MRHQRYRGASDWQANLRATTTSATTDVSSATRGTRKFRVVVSHAVVASVTSEPVYVTWDEWAIVADMIGELSAAVASSTAYTTLQTALLNCVERRTGTRPSSLTAVMSQYAGAQKLAADECDERGAVASSKGDLALNATRTFQTLHQLFKATLVILKNGNSVYAGYLDTPQGRALSEDIASPRSVKFAATVVTSMVAAPVATTTGGSGGRSPTQPDIPDSRPTISDCLIHETALRLNPNPPKVWRYSSGMGDEWQRGAMVRAGFRVDGSGGGLSAAAWRPCGRLRRLAGRDGGERAQQEILPDRG